ncbi:hypothetical protein TNCV_2264481 [Trichonephila clavipes]|nr:hypothetical protein TNCV_2264481 [Trichonephila clavipes]
MVSVYCTTRWQKVNEQYVLPVPEHRAHHFPYRQRLFEFRPDRRSTMPLMHWLLHGFWGEVQTSSLNARGDTVEELVAVMVITLQKCQCCS